MIDIKSLRLEKGVNQIEVANLLGITRQTYSRIESGETDISFGQIVKLAEFFDVPVVDMLPAEVVDTNADSSFNRDKYKQIIQNFISYTAGSDGKITKTKLAKLCYLLDFARYYYNLSPITGLQYRKIAQGPVPDIYFTTIEELQGQEDIAVEQKGNAYLISNITSPEHTLLSIDELDLLKKIAHKWKKANTEDIVTFTHNQLPWMICYDKELIPYGLICQEELENVY